MANGSVPPIGRAYDIAAGRLQLSQALAKLSATEPASELEQLVLQAMRQTAKVLESAHASIALQQSTCHHLWEHLDGLGALMRMIGSVEGGAPSAAGALASRVPEVVRE